MAARKPSPKAARDAARREAERIVNAYVTDAIRYEGAGRFDWGPPEDRLIEAIAQTLRAGLA